MKQLSKAIVNQSIISKKRREKSQTDNRIKTTSIRRRTPKIISQIQTISRNLNLRSQTTSREHRISVVPPTQNASPLNQTSVSNLATASSQNFRNRESAALNNSSSGENLKNPRKSIDLKQQSACPRKSSVKSPVHMVKLQPNESVSIREASRIKEWASKAKPEIERMWRRLINNSNGIEPYNVVFATYSVFIGKGNNAALIKKLFQTRPWWRIVEAKDSANLVWTQWKDQQVLSELNSATATPQAKADTDLFPIVSSYKAQVATRVYKLVDIENLGMQLIRNAESYTSLRTEKIYPEQQRVHNKLEFNECLSNKKELLLTMRRYYRAIGGKVFKKLPITFSVAREGDSEFKEFLKVFQKFEAKKTASKNGVQNIWIVKPGEFTNRGQGITVCNSLAEITAQIKPAEAKTYIVQKYIEKPLLINKRKFDIRCYALATSVNGVLQGYFYLDGYLRTTSSEYNIQDVRNPLIHLTNDAIQKYSAEYGKFESGNKLSYRDFQKYLDQNYSEKKINFVGSILPVIKEMIKDTFLASWSKLDSNKRMHSMEILGYDFMIDRKFRPWLIEINTNPCLELASPYLSTLIPAMVDNSLKICVDSIFPAPLGQYLENCPVNRFELIFHQEIDGKRLSANTTADVKTDEKN